MRETAHKAIAIVGVGAVMPDAPDVSTFWSNLRNGRYSITETPADRWTAADYWDPDPKAPDKTYSKIGGWVRDCTWDPIAWKLPIPPRVSENMDRTQKLAIVAAREALADFGWPERTFNPERTAVILGNAMAGEHHYQTAMRLSFPVVARELESAPSFAGLPAELRAEIEREFRSGVGRRLPEINEDTMPGELANIIAGRIANLFNFHGPNYVVDAACASAMAAIGAAIEGLEEEDYDVVLTGGVDANMSAHTFIKFCKIGALSATGTRPYADGADGFVMGEGAALFLLKRLADAERDGDRIYAVIRGVGGSSDGKGKGITAPNPAGQKLAVERAWENAGLAPATVGLLEGHGTSTRVGDVAEVEALNSVFGQCGLPAGSIPLGSVKSNIGHLKGAAGAAGILKTALALRDKVLPPSLNCSRLNPNIDFSHLPFRVNTELRSWDVPAGTVRRAGVSAFGFGGTNFHVVLEEHVPGMLSGNGKKVVAASKTNGKGPAAVRASAEPRVPPRGIFFAGADRPEELAEKLRATLQAARAGQTPAPAPPQKADLHAPRRISIDHGNAEELAAKAEKALQALEGNHAGLWRALRAQGVFYQQSTGAPPKVAFLYTGQGSQYLGMLESLRRTEPVINETFAEADRVMTPILGRPLSSYLYIDASDPAALLKAEEELRQTAITQPAVLAVDIALTRVLAEHGIAPDLVMGHSLGEYGALVAAGSLSFAEALEAVAARGREMTRVSMADNGRMVAVMAPLEEIEQVLASIDGYAVIANINSTAQAVIGGASDAVTRAEEIFRQAGREVRPLPVSHAFHTSIVAPASEPLQEVLARLDLRPPQIPIVANATGRLYPMGGPEVVPAMIGLLGRQIAAPVQFVQGLQTLYDEGARVFVEVGPKRALHGFAEDVLGKLDDVLCLATNHPKVGDVVSLNQALCGLYAAGRGNGTERSDRSVGSVGSVRSTLSVEQPVVVTGGAVGLPGPWNVFDDANLGRLLHGEQAIDVVPLRFRRAMVDKHITRLVKSEAGARFETIESQAEVIKLAARAGELDLARDFGIPQERLDAWDRTTRLAVGAGLEALRDAGIPLVMRYKTATTGARLPDRWGLPDDMRDDTGVIFASAFPGYDSLVEIMERHQRDKARRDRVAELSSLKARCAPGDSLFVEIDRRIQETEAELARDPYVFDRRFLFRVLSMGHAQFAELIGARGPNTQINAACASTTQAFSLAQDWIRAGRCRRVVVVAADDITTDRMLGWWGAGFLASGAAATDELVEDAALPFDRRRHGLIIGMGAAAVVIESPEAAHERGLRPICELLSAETANSAFHGSRLDVRHICGVMEKLVAEAEKRWGIDRHEIAPQLVFVSHETYTPARGGSAQAEVDALRQVFGPSANRIVVANTKGYTGHPMAVGIEDVMAVKSLETGLVPPVPNLQEPDPELGGLNLSAGGAYPVRYALRLGAGFGSQIGMSLLRQVPNPDGVRRTPDALGYAYRIEDPAAWRGWLARASGDPEAEVEVVHRTLRVVDRPTHARPSAPVIAERLPEPVVAPPDPSDRSHPSAPSDVREPAVAAVAATDRVREKVLAIVAEKTGYPMEMLDLDLDLEADLGIDTVKQAETFAAIRAAWDIPRDENLKLRDFPTLGHTIQFVYDRRPDLRPSPPLPSLPSPLGEGPGVRVPAEPASDAVKEKVLALIADKTGYPVEMLDLDLDLEADLGIDTVKQAEMFAAIRQEYSIPRDENLKLRDFPTLGHTIQFVYDRRPDLKPATRDNLPPLPVEGGAMGEGGRGGEVSEAPASMKVELAVKIPRRVPVPVLRPPLDLCKPTGVTLGPGSRVVVAFDEGGVGKALAGRLAKMGVEVLDIEKSPEALGPVQGVYWLPALDREADISAMDQDAWHEALRRRVKLFSHVLRALDGDLGRPGGFVIAATRLGGRHGYDETGAVAPMGGAVSGLAKAFQREHPETLVKAVDFAPGRQTAALADHLIEETLRDPGAVEIGYEGGRRWTIGLSEEPLAAGPGLSLTPETVFVVTGAAGSIVSGVLRDLTAAARGGVFHLLDLAPEPDPADPDLARFVDDREGLKRDLFERIKARGERATPALVEKELARLERGRAALDALLAIRSAGGRAVWYRLDLRDGDAVGKAIEQVRTENGRVDVLLHAGGLEISRRLADKKPEEYDLVFDVKADGWFHLMSAIGEMPLGAAVVFSSIAGRFGNQGQTDYSAANDLLCKQVSALRHTRPGTLGIALDWTAWGGIGMATRGSIPAIMEAAGIDMLPPEIGVPWVREELTAGTRGEVVVAGRLGAMLAERDATGGLDVSAETLSRLRGGVMVGRPVQMGVWSGLEIETALDPAEQPFLDHHRIDGTPVLPGVMGVEAFAEAASFLFPDLQVVGVEDVEFLAPFKFYRNEPRTVTIRVQLRPDGDGGDRIVADCSLLGRRTLPGTLPGQTEPQVTEHFRARVRLAPEAPALDETIQGLEGQPAATVGAGDIYKVYFHGPAYQVMDEAWKDGDGVAGRMAHGLPPNHRPEAVPTVMEPRLIELCFQTAGLGELGTSGRMALPLHVDRVRTLRHPNGEPLFAVAKHHDGEGSVDAWVVDGTGNVYVALSGYRTVELPGGVTPEALTPLRNAMG